MTAKRASEATEKTEKKRRRKKERVDLDQKKYEHHHWDFPPIFVPHPEDLGLPDDWEEHVGDFDAESTCGPNDESQWVESYDGTLGVTQAFVNAHQGPVGQLQWNDNLASIYTNPGNVAGVRWCSGTLISCDLFLTAGHCFDNSGDGWQRPLVNGTTNVISSDEIATNMHVNFNYQFDPNGVLRQAQEFAIAELVEYRLDGLDFAIVRLEGNPGNTFGWTTISTTDAEEDDMLCIIQHPAGFPKKIEAGAAFHLHDTRVGYDSLDTQGGSSGSGILRSPDGQLVGVHTNGGCNAQQTGHNHGVRISSIRAASPTIQGLASSIMLCRYGGFATLKFIDDPGGGIRKPIRDVTLKFFDDPGGSFKKLRDGDFTLKHIDDVKVGGYDKQWSDTRVPGRVPIDPRVRRGSGIGGVGSGRSPFILATPHHSMAWARGFSGRGLAPQRGVSEDRAVLDEYEATLAELEHAIERAAAELQDMEEAYRSLSEEYTRLAEQRQ